MTTNFKLTIEYDGTRYHGWQRQPNGNSIQQEIETALSTMTRQRITLIGSGRTDAGVHAEGQTANFVCDTSIGADAFHNGLNSLLPEDIVIRECVEVPLQFHARFSVKQKQYRYQIRNHPLPKAIGRQYAWWIRAPLDLAAMSAGLAYLSGRHDFKAFEGSGSPRAHTIRTIMDIGLELEGQPKDTIAINIEADGFLRYMVRNIVGAVAMVGLKKKPPRWIKDILMAKNRNHAGATAPPQGLFLVKVYY